MKANRRTLPGFEGPLWERVRSCDLYCMAYGRARKSTGTVVYQRVELQVEAAFSRVHDMNLRFMEIQTRFSDMRRNGKP